MQDNSKTTRSLVQSHSNRERYYTYDQALAVIALSKNKENWSSAKNILTGMQKIQEPDGSWVFSFPKEPSIHSRLGSIAWMILAINHYEKKTNDLSFSQSRQRALDFIISNSFTIPGWEGPRFSNIDAPETTWNETEILSVEHLIDTIAAIETLPEALKIKNSALLKKYQATLRRHWLGNRFASGSVPSKKNYQ